MTEINISDSLAEEIHAQAKAEGVSVSDLLTKMLQEHRKTQRQSKFPHGNELVQNINEVYKTEGSSIDPVLMEMQIRSIKHND